MQIRGKNVTSGYIFPVLLFGFTFLHLYQSQLDSICGDTSSYKIFANNFSGTVNKSELDIPERKFLKYKLFGLA